MGELLLGAAIAAVFSFLGGLVVAWYQARRTETLTLRLQALQLQEQALRGLALGLSGLEAFRDLVGNRPLTNEVSDVGAYLRPWHDFMAVSKTVHDRWYAEQAAVVFDQAVGEAVEIFALSLGALEEGIASVSEAPDASNLEQLHSTGDYVLDSTAKARRKANRARRIK